MKKILLTTAILFTAFFFKADAQVSVNINIGRQPAWGPVGYDYVDYYYLPDYDVYYDVPRGLFVYYDYGRWTFAASLPARYGSYNLYNSYKVVVNEHNPWLRNNYYHSHYEGYRGRHQDIIRDSRGNRYYAERERYNHERSYERGDEDNHARRNGNDNGWGNDGRSNGRGNWGRQDHEDHGKHERGRHGRD